MRAILFDRDGVASTSITVPVEEPAAEHAGWAEHDAEYLWQCLTKACRGLWQQGGRRSAVTACAITTVRGTVVAVDSEGVPLRPAILWPDERSAGGVPRIGGWRGMALHCVGAAGRVRYFQSQAESNWLALNEADIWAGTEKFLLLSGFFHFRLTGQYRDSAAAQIGYLPFDFRRRGWARSGSWKWRALPWLQRRQLPDLVMPATAVGTVTAEASQETGLPVGLPVIAAAADKACETLGTGATAPADVCLSFGTAATVNVVTDRYRETARFLPAYPAASPGEWIMESQVNSGFWLVRWFARQFGHQELARAATMGVPTEKLLDELLQQSPPGANGLLSQPHWSPHLRRPGPEARGALVGLATKHTRADIYRALIEGLLFALRDDKERIERRLRRPGGHTFVAGGGAGSDLIAQLAADIIGGPVMRAGITETTALGAAINAAVGIGWYPDHDTATRAMLRDHVRFDPDPDKRQRYDAIYRSAYRPLFRQLQPALAALRALERRQS